MTGETKDEIIHVPGPAEVLPEIGEKLLLTIDWPRRHKLMRMHTACHLLSAICPFPITGAAVGEEESRVDFDMSETVDKADDQPTPDGTRCAQIIRSSTQWIAEEELDANPGLVKSKNVRPPRGAGRIRLVCIGEGSSIDSQPCGGTHVARTGEIGEIHIGKIEKKGRENRRFRIRFGPTPGAD